MELKTTDIHTSSRSSSKPYRSLIENLKWHIEYFVFDTLTKHTRPQLSHIQFDAWNLNTPWKICKLKFLFVRLKNWRLIHMKKLERLKFYQYARINETRIYRYYTQKYFIWLLYCEFMSPEILYIFSSTYFTNKQQHFKCHFIHSKINS